GTPQLRLRPLPGPAAVPLNGHEPLPVGRARAALAGLPGALGRGLHRSRRACRLLRHGIAPPHARRRLPVELVPPPRRGAPRPSRADRPDEPVLAGDAGPGHRRIAARTTGPIIAEIAALVGAPTRATMLSALLDGRALTASELALAARITPQTASTHLAKLTEAGLLSAARDGRHRHLRLPSPRAEDMTDGLLARALGA